jgi:hypothetical protein
MPFRWNPKPLVEERLFISTTVMKPLLKGGGVGTLSWNTGSTIGYLVPPDKSEVVLSYTITHRDDSSEEIEQAYTTNGYIQALRRLDSTSISAHRVANDA